MRCLGYLLQKNGEAYKGKNKKSDDSDDKDMEYRRKII